MVKPYPVHTKDYNEDGWVPSSCDNCGVRSDSGYSVDPYSFQRKPLSNHNLKTAFFNLWDTCGFPKNLRLELYHVFKNHRNQTSLYYFARNITRYLREQGVIVDVDTVLDCIYTVLNT